MRIILSGATIVAIMAAIPAFSADLPMKAPAMFPIAVAPAAPFSWTGCHVGGHLGGAFSQDTSTGVLGNSASHNSSGFVGGGQIGCDYEFAPGWVLGVEGRAAGSSLKASNPGVVRNLVTGVTVPTQFNVSNDFLASATGRLGYSPAYPWLFYVKGGAAWTNEKVNETFTTNQGIAISASTSSTRTGWTIGSGAEWAFAPNWSATVEYDYYDFGSKALTLTNPNGIVTIPSFKDTIHTVTTGVNYHF
jgi:outer membrane immunogenic protein